VRVTRAERPIAGAGVVLIENGKVLLVRRGQPPRAGEWSLPGGKQILGETARECALRELNEETGLEAEIVGLVDVIDALFRDDKGQLTHHYLLTDFAARRTGGELEAAGDASEAAWFSLESLDELGLWAETLRVIREARKLMP